MHSNTNAFTLWAIARAACDVAADVLVVKGDVIFEARQGPLRYPEHILSDITRLISIAPLDREDVAAIHPFKQTARGQIDQAAAHRFTRHA